MATPEWDHIVSRRPRMNPRRRRDGVGVMCRFIGASSLGRAGYYSLVSKARQGAHETQQPCPTSREHGLHRLSHAPEGAVKGFVTITPHYRYARRQLMP